MQKQRIQSCNTQAVLSSAQKNGKGTVSPLRTEVHSSLLRQVTELSTIHAIQELTLQLPVHCMILWCQTPITKIMKPWQPHCTELDWLHLPPLDLITTWAEALVSPVQFCPMNLWAFNHSTSKNPSLENGHRKNLEMKKQHCRKPKLSRDGLHSLHACHKIIACFSDASWLAAMKDQYKRQPNSQLYHPLLLSPSRWEPGKCKALSPPPAKSDFASRVIQSDSCGSCYGKPWRG